MSVLNNESAKDQEGKPLTATPSPRPPHLQKRPGVGVATLHHSGKISDVFTQGLIASNNISMGEPVIPIWFGIYPSSVTLLIGSSGTGKSSFLYNVALAIAQNEPFLDIPSGLGREGRVLYVDPENAGPKYGGSGGVRAARLERIGKPRTSNLVFHDWRNLDLADSSVFTDLASYIQTNKIDLCILDPLANVYSTSNENDNAEAARQMKAVVNLTRETGVAIVLCHHTGKSYENENMSATEGGRGASARFSAADNALFLRPASNSGDDDDDYFQKGRPQPQTIIRVRETKNRWQPRASIYIKMAGDDKFVLSSPKEWRSRVEKMKGPDKSVMAQQFIMELLADKRMHKRKDILSTLQKEGLGRPVVEDALLELEAQRTIMKRRQEGTTGFAYHIGSVSGEQAEMGHILGDLPALYPSPQSGL